MNLSLILCLVLFVHQPSEARVKNNPLPKAELPKQKANEHLRAIFLKAEQAILEKKYRKAKPLMKQLSKYPLLPYLEYLKLKQNFRLSKSKDIQAYLSKYPDHRLSNKLRNQWLHWLANKKHWQTYLKFYTPRSSITLQCHQKHAYLMTKNTKRAFQDISKIWLVGNSQPKACDHVFKAWQNSNQFNNNNYAIRAQLALDKRQFSLAKFLARKSKNAKTEHHVKQWIATYNKPKLIGKKRYPVKNAKQQAMILMAMKRLVRTDLEAFEKQWSRYHRSLNYDDESLSSFLHFVARWYSWHYYPTSSEWLELADPNHTDYELMQRRIRLAIYNRQWPQVRDWIYTLDAKQQQEQAWRYWLVRSRFEILTARINAKLDRLPPGPLQSTTAFDPMALHKRFIRHLSDENLGYYTFIANKTIRESILEMHQEFQDLSKNRSFYGFMASEILNRPLSLNHQSIRLTAKQRREIESIEGILASNEWYRLDRLAEAQSEWVYTISGLGPTEKTYAAKLAHEWGWHHQAIYTAAFSDHKDDLVVRFPLGFFDIVYEQTLNQRIYADWTFALIRQESAYRPNARSPVGALGLMQLMPSTAKLVIKKKKERYPGNKALLKPQRNIETGTRYMASLYDQFNGNLLLATAAYNAGPRRAKSWQDPEKSIPGDIWIETIPIQETREYVKNIMTYQAIYRWHLGNQPRLSASLERVPPLRETFARKTLAVK